jgi:hypothetical protein
MGSRKHFTNPKVGIVGGSIALIFGTLLVLGPSRSSTGGAGLLGAFPNWALGAVLIARGALYLVLGIRQARSEK